MNDRVGIHCLECGLITEFPSGHEADYNDPCPGCAIDPDIKDPYCVEIVVIRPCPNETKVCGSQFHHWGRGDHVLDDRDRPERLQREAREAVTRQELQETLDEFAQNDRSVEGSKP